MNDTAEWFLVSIITEVIVERVNYVAGSAWKQQPDGRTYDPLTVTKKQWYGIIYRCTSSTIIKAEFDF